MPTAESEGSVAILLDFENAKDADLQRLLAEAARFGRVTVRRAYADWTRFGASAAGLREAGFEEIHQSATGGRGSKNATDIHLVVDAMDLLYTRPVDTFVLVTADSDFAKLARRLREGGKRVIGLGARGRVGRALVQSCDEYVYYDAPQERESAGGTAQHPKPAPRREVREKSHIEELKRIVLDALDRVADETGRAYGGPLHEAIRRVHPDFSYRDYGFSSFRKSIEALAPEIRSGNADDASDFVVWTEASGHDPSHRAPPARSNGARATLSDEVQRAIDRAWTDLAGGRKRLSGRRAGEAVGEEYGVSRLADTPLVNLDGVFAAAPWLGTRWRRDGAWLVART